MLDLEVWQRGDWIMFAVSALLVIYLVSWKLVFRGSSRLPPGRLAWPLWDDTIEYVKSCENFQNPDKWIDERRAKYGNVFKARVFNTPTVFLLGSKANRWLFQNEHQFFKQTWPKSMRDILGSSSLSIVHGEHHRHIRQFFDQILGTEYVKRYMGAMEESTLHSMERWKRKDVISFYEEHLKQELFTSIKLCMGAAEGLDLKHLYGLFAAVSANMVCLPVYLPGTRYWNGYKARDGIVKMIYPEIHRRRAEYEAGLSPLGSGGRLSSENLELARDLLDLFMFWEADKEKEKSNPERSMKFSDKEIVENIIGLITGAHGSTVSTVTSTIQILSSRPDIIDELRKEIRSVAEMKAPKELLTWSDTRKLRYLRNVLYETMRYRSTVYFISKSALCDVEFDGYKIPKGWVVNTIMRQTHNKEECFSSPEVFDPKRFEQSVDIYSYLPFGRGPRICPGEKYAMVEMQIFLYHFLQRYDYELIHPSEEFTMFFAPTPNQGLQIKLKPLL